MVPPANRLPSAALRISCVVCTYNYGNFLERCLQSILTQTLPRECYEVIVVDDGSTDDTHQVLAKFSDSVRVIRQPNHGLAAASNTGVLVSKGAYFLRVDADDELFPEALELLAQALDDHPSACAVYPDRVEVDETGRERAVQYANTLNIYELIAPGIMFRRARVLEVGLYRFFYWEEHDLMIRLLQRYPVHHVPHPLYCYHLHGANMTGSAEARRGGWGALIETWGMEKLRKWGQWPELEEVYREVLTRQGEPR